LEGIESLLGGGYVSYGNAIKRTSTLKTLSSQMSTLSNKTQKSILSWSNAVKQRASYVDASFNSSQILKQSHEPGRADSTIEAQNQGRDQASFEFDPNQSPEIE